MRSSYLATDYTGTCLGLVETGIGKGKGRMAIVETGIGKGKGRKALLRFCLVYVRSLGWIEQHKHLSASSPLTGRSANLLAVML